MSKKLNREQKLALKVGKLATFLRQYGRKAQRATEPNDRRYDREVETSVKRMPAEKLDHLLNEDEE